MKHILLSRSLVLASLRVLSFSPLSLRLSPLSPLASHLSPASPSRLSTASPSRLSPLASLSPSVALQLQNHRASLSIVNLRPSRKR